jgi:Lrp/AsnC family transcriptional regulator, regulator for asnA, asnC and gidA
MDRLDYEILALLQQDGRRSFTEIGKVVGYSEGTIRKRVTRLVDDGLIRIIGLVDPHRVGFDAPAIIQVSVIPPHLEAAAQAIAQFPEVSYLLMVSGEFDLIVEVRCRNREHLASFIRDHLQKVAGVQRTVSSLVLHTYKLAEPSVLDFVAEETASTS